MNINDFTHNKRKKTGYYRVSDGVRYFFDLIFDVYYHEECELEEHYRNFANPLVLYNHIKDEDLKYYWDIVVLSERKKKIDKILNYGRLF